MREMGGPQRRWLRAGFIWHSLTKFELVGMDRAQAPRFGVCLVATLSTKPEKFVCLRGIRDAHEACLARPPDAFLVWFATPA
uniref:Uncharacterized protein n=1 Tax=Oryza rufipogon TaxID=4529 RepID=A0A0E0QN13_ORYRU